MDFTYLVEVLPGSTQELVWWFCFSILTLVVFKILLRSNAEDAIEFSVPVPEACRAGWEGKQLDEPSIKVCSNEGVYLAALLLICQSPDIWKYSCSVLQSGNRSLFGSLKLCHCGRNRSNCRKGQ